MLACFNLDSNGAPRPLMEIPMHHRLLLCILVLATAPAFANTACDNPRDDFDGLYCLNKLYQQADAELNSLYKKLRPALDAQGSARLKSGQLAWIEERNSKCSRRNEEGFFVNMACASSMTIKRAQFLQDRLRECQSTGCQNSKL